ncbi:hypothetical protein [Paenibacillus wulumuqiensis]|uniref:hypothetical protein n=1 Tax=Paenibacillus wulumuqiensis TaxID=1567107 RepID=UPI00061A0A3F|nr:hypothetical protein [Paenibacillus wulumuqiensis]
MDNTTIVSLFLLIALVFSVMTNFLNSRKMSTMEKNLYEAYKDNSELKTYIQQDLKQESKIDSIKKVRGRYGLSIEHAQKIVDMYK